MEPDLALARRFLAANPPGGVPLLVAVTGSHIYGFTSADSDIDMKGLHLAPLDAVLGLDPITETHDRLKIFEGVECDLTTHEARKALGLLLGGNGNLLEQILSPIQLLEDIEAIQALGRGAISKRFMRHYRGFFGGMCREHLRSEKRSAKTLLYAYRVALTGVHLMRTGELVCDLERLASEHGFEPALELIEFKRAAREKSQVPPELDALHQSHWPALEAAMAEALEASTLPEEPPNRAACSDWLVQTRRRLA